MQQASDNVSKAIQAVVLAAGRGTRLGHLTADRSKAMLPVAGEPLVGRVIECLWQAGLRRFIVVGGTDDAELKQYCRLKDFSFRSQEASDTWADRDVIEFAVQDRRLGMAHALTCAAPFIDGPFVLTACDNLVEYSFVASMVATLRETEAHGVLALLHMPPKKLRHSAAVELTPEGRVRRIIEKPSQDVIPGTAASIALYAFGPRLLEYLDVPVSARGEQELQTAVQALIDDGGDVRGRFAPGRQTVSRPNDLLALNLHHLEYSSAFEIQTTLADGVTVLPPVRIERGVEVGRGTRIGPRVYLERGCRVGENARLQDAVVLRTGIVPDGTELAGGIWPLAASG